MVLLKIAPLSITPFPIPISNAPSTHLLLSSPSLIKLPPLTSNHRQTPLISIPSHLDLDLILTSSGGPHTMGGRLHGEHLRQLRDIFARFDMDSDGSLTHLELAALLRSLGLKPSGDQIHALLSNMDANGNGAVEFDELVVAISPIMNEQALVNQEQLLDVFRSFDRDGNGYISAAELARSMARMGHPLTFSELTDMMRQADTDGDGVISFTEFAAVMAKSASEFLGLAVS